MELIAGDLRIVEKMFVVLESAAKVDGVEDVVIQFRARGGDTIEVGYGEQAEPAILAVEPYEEPS